MHNEGYLKDQAEIKRLLREARGENEAAFSQLLAIYEPLILSMLSKYVLEYDSHNDTEDIHQELRVAFYNAVRSYDLEQSAVDFGFFAKVCLKNALVSRLRLKKGHSVEILPIEEVAGLYSSDRPDDGILESESIEAVRRLINENLSEYEKTVWNLYLDGKTPKQIAEKLGKDAKSISNALSRIRAKLRERVDDHHHI